jgi:hypothetical protein
MRYLLLVVLALGIGAWVGVRLTREQAPPDPITVIVTQLKTQAVIEHERQIAVWYKACPKVTGVDPHMFVAWPGKLSFELPLTDVALERHGSTLQVHTSAIRADEPALPTEQLDSLSTEPLLNLADENELVNAELKKASGIARYLAAYHLKRDPTLYEAMEDELRALILRIAGAIDAGVTEVKVEIPRPDPKLPPLPTLELCSGSRAAVNGLPFAKDESGYLVPVAFQVRSKGTAPGSEAATEAALPSAAAIIYRQR